MHYTPILHGCSRPPFSGSSAMPTIAVPTCRRLVSVPRHCLRVAKEMDSKSIGLCPQGLESPRCRSSPQLALVRRRSHQAPSRMGALDRRLRSSRSPAMGAWRRSDPCGQAGARAGQGRRGGGVGMTAGRLEPAASGRGAWQLCARGPLGHHSCGARAHALSQLCKVNRPARPPAPPHLPITFAI